MMDPVKIQHYTSDSKMPITSYLQLQDLNKASSEYKPVSENIKINYGVTYVEPADKRRQGAAIKLGGLRVHEAP